MVQLLGAANLWYTIGT